MKKYWPWLIAAVLLIFGALSEYKYFTTKADLKAAQAKYDAYRKLSSAGEAALDAKIKSLTEDNVKKINEVLVLNGQIITDDHDLAVANQTISDLKKHASPTTAAIEAMPVVINLRAQVQAYSLALDAAQKEVADVKKSNINLSGILTNDEKIIADLTAKYNSEYALRMSCEALAAQYKKAVAPSFFGVMLKDWKQDIAIAVIAGIAGHFVK